MTRKEDLRGLLTDHGSRVPRGSKVGRIQNPEGHLKESVCTKTRSRALPGPSTMAGTQPVPLGRYPTRPTREVPPLLPMTDPTVPETDLTGRTQGPAEQDDCTARTGDRTR